MDTTSVQSVKPGRFRPAVSRCSVFGSLNLTTVKLSGVGGSFQKHTEAESKGIKAHFNMDESGVLLLDRVSSFHHFSHEESQLQHIINIPA